MAVVQAMAERMFAAVATRGRLIALAVIAAVGVVVAALIRLNADDGSFEPADYVRLFGLAIFVPLVAMMVATATLGTLRDERTLAYFWLRPIARSRITLAALAAGFALLLPVVLVPMGLIGLVVGDSTDAVGAVISGLVGVTAYGAVFTLAGLLSTRALLWGLVYLLVWEGVIAGFSRTAGWLAVSTYTRSALARVTGADVIDDPPSGLTIAIVTVAIVVVAGLVTTWRLERMDID